MRTPIRQLWGVALTLLGFWLLGASPAGANPPLGFWSRSLESENLSRFVPPFRVQ